MYTERQQPRSGGPKRWYANAYVLVVFFISAAAMGVAGLLFLLLPSSSEIIPVMQWRMVRTKSMFTEIDLAWTGEDEKKKEKFVLSSSGWLDGADEQKRLVQQAFSIKEDVSGPSSWEGEYRRVGQADYVNFDKLPEKIGLLDVAPFGRRWLRFDSGRLRRGMDAPIFGSGVALKELDRRLLFEELRRTPFFRFESRLGNDTLGGVVTHHYQVMPEILFFKDFFIRYESMRLGRELNRKERQTFDTFFANVTPDQGELWIGRGDYFLYRMRLRFRYDDGRRDGVFSFTANFGRFNQPSGVAAPDGDMDDITSILESLLPGIAAHLPLAKDGKIQRGTAGANEGSLPVSTFEAGGGDPDKDGLTDSLEYFYRTDPNNPDTDGDGVNDGDEVAKGLNPTGSGNLFDFGISDSLR